VEESLLADGMTKVEPIGSPSQRADRRSKQWNDEKQIKRKKRGALLLRLGN